MHVFLCFNCLLQNNVYLVSKHLRHCVGSTKVPGWKPLTVDQVFYLHCHCNPHRPRLATTCFNDGLENET